MTDPAESASRRGMFASIHRTYDLLNHGLSLGLDRVWRRRTRELLRVHRGERVLDVCTGTGDLALEFTGRAGMVVGADYTPQMLAHARDKVARRRAPLQLLVADTLALPFEDGVFDVVTVAFGIRNVVDLDAALAEMVRVSRPGGRLGILEFSSPRGGLARLSFLLVRAILPRLGRLVSRHGWAYAYLPASILDFADRDELARRMVAAGLDTVQVVPMIPDFVTLHTGRCRPASGEATG